jgi:putative tryptophan/tyrosine transport system substrate-binding protein
MISRQAIADDNIIAVFYPRAKEPYNSIYQAIISGGKSKAAEHNIQFKEYLLDKNVDNEEIIKELDEQKIHKVIVLGRSGWKLAKQLSAIKLPSKEGIASVKKYQVVSGALPIYPNGVSGISLITDPFYLFDYLKKVAPSVTQIHAAYSEKNEWLIEIAKLAAIEKGFKLNLQKVSNTKEAIAFYQELFESEVTENDSIWLPLDRVSSNDKITLPLILEKSWAKEMVVFSSKPSHAKRGALFSTYPDNFSLGEHLFSMVQELKNQPEQKKFATLKSTLLAVNLRTAAHLGLKYSAQQQQEFKLTFPE